MGIALMPKNMLTSLKYTGPNHTGTHCTLCDDNLLRHIRKGGIRWFCPTCRQDMPSFAASLNVGLTDSLNANIKPIYTEQALTCDHNSLDSQPSRPSQLSAVTH